MVCIASHEKGLIELSNFLEMFKADCCRPSYFQRDVGLAKASTIFTNVLLLKNL